MNKTLVVSIALIGILFYVLLRNGIPMFMDDVELYKYYSAKEKQYRTSSVKN